MLIIEQAVAVIEFKSHLDNVVDRANTIVSQCILKLPFIFYRERVFRRPILPREMCNNCSIIHSIMRMNYKVIKKRKLHENSAYNHFY